MEMKACQQKLNHQYGSPVGKINAVAHAPNGADDGIPENSWYENRLECAHEEDRQNERP